MSISLQHYSYFVKALFSSDPFFCFVVKDEFRVVFSLLFLILYFYLVLENFIHSPNLPSTLLRCSLTNVHIQTFWPLFIFKNTLSPDSTAHICMVWGYLHKVLIVPEMTLLRKTNYSYFNSYQLLKVLQSRIRDHVPLFHPLPLMLKGWLAWSCEGYHRCVIPWTPWFCHVQRILLCRISPSSISYDLSSLFF